MYEGGIRVPFVVAGPNVARNSISRVPVTGLDLLPTLAEMSGFSGELPAEIDGGSLVPLLVNRGQGAVKRRQPYLVFHQAVKRKPQSAIRLEDYKLIQTAAGWELFDLSKDVGESNNLAARFPEKTDQLQRMLARFLSDVDAETRQIDDVTP